MHAFDHMLNSKPKRMKNICYFLSAVTFLFSCSQPVDRSALKSEIEKANQEFMDAVAARDANAVAALYTEDALVLPPNTPAIQGREGARNFFSGAINSGVSKVNLVTHEVEGDGQTAIERGAYEMMVDGDVVVDKGKYLVHWRNVDGEWKLNKDMFNSDLPAAPVLKKGNVLGLHVITVKLNPGVTRDQFFAFYKNSLVPAFEKHWPDVRTYMLKGLRGEQKNSVGVMYFFESDDIRNKYFKADGRVTEAGAAILEKVTPVFDEMNKRYGTDETKYTDWVIE
jgi:uncharacterized protein (TIGR02246 family)